MFLRHYGWLNLGELCSTPVPFYRKLMKQEQCLAHTMKIYCWYSTPASWTKNKTQVARFPGKKYFSLNEVKLRAPEHCLAQAIKHPERVWETWYLVHATGETGGAGPGAEIPVLVLHYIQWGFFQCKKRRQWRHRPDVSLRLDCAI